MRPALLLLALLSACASVSRGWPEDKPIPEDAALLAGRLDFAGTGIRRTLYLAPLDGGPEVVVRPRKEPFLVDVPPGSYVLVELGTFAPSVDRPLIDAVAGKARYIGTLVPARDDRGDLKLIVQDRRKEVEEALRKRYGPKMPELEPGLVRSSLRPLKQGQGDLVLDLQRIPIVYYAYPPPYGTWYSGYGFYRRWPHHFSRP